MARTIFPELKTMKKTKNKSEKDVILKGFNHGQGHYVLDLVMQNSDGEYFIIKDFGSKSVTVNDLNELVDVIFNKFGPSLKRFGRIPKEIFRIICVAKEYDSSFLKSESTEKNMEKLTKNFRIDLLIEEKNGYSLLWVS